MLTLYFDGSCEPVNPGGIACYGWVLMDEDGNKIDEGYGEVCRGSGATNNVAEYAALEAGLTRVLEKHWVPDGLLVRGDSQLVVHQVSRVWECRKEYLRARRDRCIGLLHQIGDCRIEWIRRDKNTEADALARRAYELAIEALR